MRKKINATLLKMPKRHTPVLTVDSRILFLRHQRVILDADIAELYGVPVKVLNQRSSATESVFLRISSSSSRPKSTKF